VRNDLAGLFGLRAVTASEVPRGAKFDESMVKQLTGGDTITARFLFQEYFDFAPQFKIILAVNHKPAILGTDEGIWRRIRLIPFDVVISPEQRDRHLLSKLRAELPGILAWAVEGCRLWQRDGLGDPEAVAEATQQYRDESDTFGEFLTACCQVNPAGHVLAGALFTAYETWTRQSGVETLRKDAFVKLMSERNMPSKTMRIGGRPQRVYHGLVLRPEWAPQRPPGEDGDPL
jgi:putative DNA primase/helicase